MLNAVEHAHKQGVIHRDLRPANVFVTGEGMVKVGDFGTSRFLEIAAHGTTVIGSPPYMAPEQFEGRAVFASDLYSLGVTMYQLLTGVLPYDTPAPTDIDRLRRGELASAARAAQPVDSCRARRDRHARAEWRSVSARYQRAEELLNDLLARATRDRPSPGRGRGRGDRHTRRENAANTDAVDASSRQRGSPAVARRRARTILLALPQAAARASGTVPLLW